MTRSRIIIYAGSLFLILFILNGCRSLSENKKNSSTDKQWEKLGPGGGGAIFIPTFSYSSPDKFLLRCDMTGSYLSRDGGNSYQQIDLAGGASSYAWDPVDSNIVYIGSACLSRSTDGGRKWERVFPPLDEITGEQFRGDHADYSIKTSESSLYDGASGRIGAIHPDRVKPGYVYFSMGSHLYYPDNSPSRWQKVSLGQPVNYIYENNLVSVNDLYLFTGSAIEVFNRISHSILSKKLPESMSPAFSFTAGTEKGTGKVIFYALHHDTSLEIRGEFGHTEVWKSEDLGNTWKRIMDNVVTNISAGIKPSYSMIACAESDASQAYLITNRYEEKISGNKFKYWYGAFKTNDAGNTWEWVWKGGGGSGQYGVKDGIGVTNLKDAWAQKAFGGEYIRLMDVGVAPFDGNIAIVTDWYRTMKTVDGGKNWKEIYSITQPDGSYITRGLDVTTAYGVHFDPFDSNHIAISYTDIGYHHSFNRGKSWQRSAEGVPAEWVNTCYWVVFDPDIKNKVWSVWSSIHDIPRGKMTRNPGWREYGKRGSFVFRLTGEKRGSQVLTEWALIHQPLPLYWTPGQVRVIAHSMPVCTAKVYSNLPMMAGHGKLSNNGIEDNRCAFELTTDRQRNSVSHRKRNPCTCRMVKKEKHFIPGAVYRSSDGAATWTKLHVAEGNIFPNGIEYDRKNPDRLYLGCWADIELSDLVGGDVVRQNGGNESIIMPGGIFLSADGGDTWKQIFDKKQYVYDVTFTVITPEDSTAIHSTRQHTGVTIMVKSWNRIRGYDFHWGQRIIVDQNDPEKVYITTFGSSVWHGMPVK